MQEEVWAERVEVLTMKCWCGCKLVKKEYDNHPVYICERSPAGKSKKSCQEEMNEMGL